MKVKNLFITLGLSLALGVVAAVGAGQKAEKAEATIGEIGLYVDLDWSDIQQVKAAIGTAQYADLSSVSSAYGDYYISVASGFTLNSISFYFRQYDNNYWHPYISESYDDQNNTIAGTFVPGHDYQITGITWKHETSYANKWFTYTLNDLTSSHVITKYEVLDGVLNETPIASEYNDGSVNYVPARRNKSGYHFGGWFSNEACTTPYVEQKITVDTSLYAKYTTLSKDSYIYYVTDSESATSNMIHTWGGDIEYANRDVSITGISGVAEVHGVLQFRGSVGLIYKIPFSSESEDTAFKFHYNNWASESPEKALAAGSAYYWSAEDGYDAAAAGDALDFLLAAEVIRNAVRKANGAPADYSVCGISAEDAAELCSDYNKLSEKARGYVDTTNVHTYNPEAKLDVDPEHQTEVTYLRVMQELAAKAGVSLAGHSASRLVPTSSTASNNMIIIVIIASALVLITVAGCFLIKRKHN